MEGKEAIIKRIISDAEKKAKAIIDNAESQASERKSEAEEWAKDYRNAQESILNKNAKEIVERRLTVADLDVRKIVLREKQQVIAKVFDLVLDKMNSLDKSSYLSFVAKLIEENADEKDEIVLSCDNVLTPNDIKGLKVVLDKKLSVSKDLGAFKGGVMLIGEKCDKDLTFKAVIESQKSELISGVAEQLFN